MRRSQLVVLTAMVCAGLLPPSLGGQTPTIFEPGVISTSDYELNAAFSPSGDTILVTKSSFGHWFMTSFFAVKAKAGWRLEVAPYSGTFSDADAIFSEDGRTIMFISNRPTASGDTTPDFNIWKTRLQQGRWSAPELLPEPINGPGDDYYPSETRSGTIYFSAARAKGVGRYDIYRVPLRDGVYQPAELLPANVNGPGSDIDLYVDPGERFIIFASYQRKDEMGGGDLYISVRCSAMRFKSEACAQGGEWSDAQNLGPNVNSPAREYTPFIFRGFLYFTSERNFRTGRAAEALTANGWKQRMHAPGNGAGDIYRVPLTSIAALQAVLPAGQR